ncbi:MAG: response regulator [Planctomycetota bacterium]
MAQGDVNRELVAKFRSMTLDRLERLTLALLELERNPDDEANEGELLRECHTLKGEAKMMGFADVQLVAHRLEDLLRWARERRFRVPQELNDILLTGFDMIGLLVQKKPGDQEIVDLPEFMATVDTFLRNNESKPETKPEAKPEPPTAPDEETKADPPPDDDAPTVTAAPAPAPAPLPPTAARITASAGAASLLQPEAEWSTSSATGSRSGEETRLLDPATSPSQSTGALDLSVLRGGRVDRSERHPTGRLPQVGDADTTATTIRLRSDREPGGGTTRRYRTRMQHRGDENSIRIDLDKLDNLLTLAGDLLLGHERSMQRVDLAREMRDEMRNYMRELHELARELPQLNDDLFTGEARIGGGGWGEAAVASRARNVTDTARSLLAGVERLLRELRDESFRSRNQLETLEISVRELRLLPVGTLFRRYPRAIRDLAKEQGKEVNVRIHGEAVELDKRILDQISEPLLHLIRNAVDHGIEDPDSRVAAGKPPEATLRLSARHIGALVEIEVADDGRGIDPDGVRRAAVQRGALTIEESQLMQSSDLIELIFDSGFTTRNVISDVSGRGVGLDVVRETIEELGGTVQVISQTGAGSRFVMQVPVRVAISKAQIVRLGQDRYAIPSEELEKLVSLPASELATVGNGIALRYRTFGTTTLRGELQSRQELVPIEDLARLLRMPALPDADEIGLAIIHHGGRRQALRVDEFLGEQEIVRRPFNRFLEGVTVLSGTTILPDGGIVPILNIVEVMRLTGDVLRVREGAVAPRGSALDTGADDAPRPAGGTRARRVLLVEDSEITRELLVEILRQKGYRVTEARNGYEALEALRLEVPDLIVTDVDMPEMNGFEMLEQLRGQPEYYNVPVVVLTTRGDDVDKRRALELGANAYLV